MSSQTPTPPSRTAFVPGERLAGWIGRFEASHGPAAAEQTDAGLELTAGDGASALLEAPWPEDGRPGTGTTAAERLAALAGQARTTGIVLLRRGGYAVGLARGGELVASKAGRRRVQSRTAAGGWSQQRYARRRANQADELVEAAAGHAAAILLPAPPEYLVLGGDRVLCRALLSEPKAARLGPLPQLRFLDVPDPTAAVLRRAAADAAAVRITVTDAPGPAS